MLVNCAGMNPNESYVIEGVRTGLHKHTNALTHLIALRRNTKSEETHIKVLHALLQYGTDARARALYEVTPHVEGEEIYLKEQILSSASGQSLMAFISWHLECQRTPMSSYHLTSLPTLS